MDALLNKRNLVRELQQEILKLQGFKPVSSEQNPRSNFLGAIASAFPGNDFPTGTVHEFISYQSQQVAATSAFIGILLHHLMCSGGRCIWVSAKRNIYAPALKLLGIEPDAVIFIDVTSEKDVLWAIEESLKCEALTAVVADCRELSFTQSRRLQLAVETSHVTGFIHRNNPRTENTVACVSRWKINPIASFLNEEMPGVGFPRWDVQLVKVRNGKPANWQIEWNGETLNYIKEQVFSLPLRKVKTA